MYRLKRAGMSFLAVRSPDAPIITIWQGSGVRSMRQDWKGYGGVGSGCQNVGSLISVLVFKMPGHLNLFTIFGMKNEKTNSPTEKKILSDNSSPQFPDAHISFNVPIKKVNMNVPTMIPRPVPNR